MVKKRPIITIPPIHILTRFQFNIKRVVNLVTLFEELQANAIDNVNYKEDILRSAVVLLHASLEDVIRNLLEWKWNRSDSRLPDSMTFPNESGTGEGPKKLSPEELVSRFRNQDWNDIVKECVHSFLDHHNINNASNLAKDLKHLGVDPEKYEHFFPIIDKAIARRHLIVHRSDRTIATGESHGKPNSIKGKVVEEWATTVGAFVIQLLKEPFPVLKRQDK